MPRQVYKTDRRLWLLASCCVFAILAFIDPFGGLTKQNASLASHTWHLVRGDFVAPAEGVRIVAFMSAVLAVPATILGWVVQALVVTLRSRWRDELPKSNLTPGERAG